LIQFYSELDEEHSVELLQNISNSLSSNEVYLSENIQYVEQLLTSMNLSIINDPRILVNTSFTNFTAFNDKINEVIKNMDLLA
jgi:hypothetical protein